ncbi:MAG: hypothetical protein JOZ18_19440 [Chloroflexi bacterium]|nr:hypothetical protein [Chloroflexota bacterium]
MQKLPIFGGAQGGDENKTSGKWNWRWVVVTISLLAIIGVVGLNIAGSAFAAKSSSGGSKPSKTVTVWIQVTDSCRQALSGATFSVSGPGIKTTTTKPTSGGAPVGLPGGAGSACPIQQGTCLNFSTGCTTATLNVPTTGTFTYTITVKKTAPGQGTNASYASCDGGSQCHNPEKATVIVNSSGSVSATITNEEPDGTIVKWPTTKAAYTGSQTDPLLYHQFGVSSGFSDQCDGDKDADDHLTGTPSQHCDGDEVNGKHA